MGDIDIVRTSPDGDPIHAQLAKAVEKRQSGYLWIPEHAIKFTPHVLPVIYGDGRTLFKLTTINQRPAYWVIRACSTWGSGYDSEDNVGPDFAELTDDILTDLEEAFGRGTCGYSGSSLFWPKRERMRNCKCEECEEGPMARWPMVNDSGGCIWSRTDWPAGFETEANPLNWRGNLLKVQPNTGDQT